MSGSWLLWLGVPITILFAGTCACFGEVSASQPPDAATRKTIEKKMAELAEAITGLKAKAKDDAKLAGVLPDVEIYHQAAIWVTKLNEFAKKETAGWTVEVLDRGLERAKKAKNGDFSWLTAAGRTMVRGYRSAIDDSVQPYAVTLPADYGKDPKRQWRLDMVMHGRDNDLTEVKFLRQHGDKAAAKDLTYIKIDVFGRGNNAYRWAGEMDVLEAKAAFENCEQSNGRGGLIDKRRQVLRGFSMGGAGAWHIGLHYPDKWCVIGPGAGFTTTHGYVGKMPADLGWPQEQMLRIYDAVPYAENAFNVPVVAYGGDKDPQLQASKNIEAALKTTKLPLDFQILVAPGLAHQFPAEWQKKAEDAYAPFVKKGRGEYPEKVRLVTYTLKYPSCDWVEVIGLQKHYEKTLVDAEKTKDGFKVAATNVSLLRLRLRIDDPSNLKIVINKQKLDVKVNGSSEEQRFVYLRHIGKDKWSTMQMELFGPVTPFFPVPLPNPALLEVIQAFTKTKTPGLQGPIDDAFTGPFLCVRGTGEAWSKRVHAYGEANLKRFQEEWAKYMRGELPVKNDVNVTKEDIAGKHLIVFGDPGSNSLIAGIAVKHSIVIGNPGGKNFFGYIEDQLPIKWTKEKIEFYDKSFPTKDHVPLLISRNPLNSNRYIVLNSGHTFHADDFKGTNALLYPRYGDYAVLKLADKGGPLAVERVELNGLFDESWKVYAGK